MQPLEGFRVPTIVIGPNGAVEAVECRLRCSGYLALRNVWCEYDQGVLTLRGCLPSYYLKQMAYAVVADLEGVGRINNQIEVLASARHACAAPPPADRPVCVPSHSVFFHKEVTHVSPQSQGR